MPDQTNVNYNWQWVGGGGLKRSGLLSVIAVTFLIIIII